MSDIEAPIDAWDVILADWAQSATSAGIRMWTPPGATHAIAYLVGNDLTFAASWGEFQSGACYNVENVAASLGIALPETAAVARPPLPQLEPHGERRRDPVDRELEQLRIRAEARRRLAEEQGGEVAIAAPIRLSDFLAVDEPEPEYRVDALLPTGGNALLAAQHKAGKSTLVANLLRSLVDGDTFLDRHQVRTASVALIDDELDPRTLRRWLAEQGIRDTDQITVTSLRGRVAGFDILNPQIRARWAAQLRGADVLIFDCLRPALDALGLDENHDAGQFLVALDALKAEAGISELLVVHHMGHSGERSRGDSRILDWPDAIWKVVREKPDDTDSPRYFSAFGRDVDVHETRLEFDPLTRRLSASGESRRMAAVDYAAEAVVALLGEQPDGMTQHAIETALKESGIPRSDIREALHQLQKRDRTVCVPAARNAKKHVLINQFASSPDLAVSSPASTPTTSPPPLRGWRGGEHPATTEPTTSPTGELNDRTPHHEHQ